MEIAPEARLMVAVLLLEMLGLQEHSLAPENGAKLIHCVPPLMEAKYSSRGQVERGVGIPLIGSEIDDFHTPIFIPTLGSVIRGNRVALPKSPHD